MKLSNIILISVLSIVYICLNILTIYGLIISNDIFNYIFYFVFLFAVNFPFMLVGGQTIYFYYRPLRNRTSERWKNWKFIKKSKKNGDLLIKILDEKYIAQIIMEYLGNNEENGIEVVIS